MQGTGIGCFAEAIFLSPYDSYPRHVHSWLARLYLHSAVVSSNDGHTNTQNRILALPHLCPPAKKKWKKIELALQERRDERKYQDEDER